MPHMCEDISETRPSSQPARSQGQDMTCRDVVWQNPRLTERALHYDHRRTLGTAAGLNHKSQAPRKLATCGRPRIERLAGCAAPRATLSRSGFLRLPDASGSRSGKDQDYPRPRAAAKPHGKDVTLARVRLGGSIPSTCGGALWTGGEQRVSSNQKYRCFPLTVILAMSTLARKASFSGTN